MTSRTLLERFVEALDDEELLLIAFIADNEIKIRKRAQVHRLLVNPTYTVGERECYKKYGKIAAIKMHRTRTGLPLKAALAAFEAEFPTW